MPGAPLRKRNAQGLSIVGLHREIILHVPFGVTMMFHQIDSTGTHDHLYTLDCIEGPHVRLGISIGCSRGFYVRCICTSDVEVRTPLNEEVYDQIYTYFRLHRPAI